jgi:hypothetical protein
MNLFEQRLVVQQAYQKHANDAAEDPIDLPDVGTRELRVSSGTLDFEHTDGADHQDEDQEQPIEVAV